MSWVRESKKSWVHRACEHVLKAGPIPKHVAFIMDGNRRFASKNRLERSQGHLMGFDKLAETLEWCLDLGITEVTVYAFSIENFKRSKEEVDGLMELARQKFARLQEEKEELDKHGVCIRVLGNITLLPKDIQEMIAEASNFTKHNSRAILNVCFSYTSRDEICTAMREVAEGVQQGLIQESDISEELLSRCLYTNKSPDPDLLVRTSGEVRLSDFLLWQTTYSVLSFMRVLWPEFSVWHLYGGILHYQRNHAAVQAARDSNRTECERLQKESDYQCVMKVLREDEKTVDNIVLSERLKSYAKERQHRTQIFLKHVESKRESYLNSLLSRENTKSITCSV